MIKEESQAVLALICLATQAFQLRINHVFQREVDLFFLSLMNAPQA